MSPDRPMITRSGDHGQIRDQTTRSRSLSEENCPRLAMPITRCRELASKVAWLRVRQPPGADRKGKVVAGSVGRAGWRVQRGRGCGVASVWSSGCVVPASAWCRRVRGVAECVVPAVRGVAECLVWAGDAGFGRGGLACGWREWVGGHVGRCCRTERCWARHRASLVRPGLCRRGWPRPFCAGVLRGRFARMVFG